MKMSMQANNIDYLAEKNLRTGLDTGDISDILQISQHYAIELIDSNWVKHRKIGRGNFRRVQIEEFLKGALREWNYKEHPYAYQRILHFMEVAGLDPQKQKPKLEFLVGKGGLRFYYQEAIYTTDEAAELMCVSQQTVIRSVDDKRLEGYRLPVTAAMKKRRNFRGAERRIPAGAIARYVADNNIRLDEGVEIAPSPQIITFPDPFLGYERYNGGWNRGTKVADKTTEKQSVWYRYGDKVREVSIRQDENEGLYIKLIGMGKKNPRIGMILLGKINRNSDGSLLSRKKHLKKLFDFLSYSVILLNSYSCGSKTKQQKAFKVVSKAQSRLNKIYFSK